MRRADPITKRVDRCAYIVPRHPGYLGNSRTESRTYNFPGHDYPYPCTREFLGLCVSSAKPGNPIYEVAARWRQPPDLQRLTKTQAATLTDHGTRRMSKQKQRLLRCCCREGATETQAISDSILKNILTAILPGDSYTGTRVPGYPFTRVPGTSWPSYVQRPAR
eukprot:357734-Rhodomonas_salina.1